MPQNRTLDWKPRYDERSRNYSAVAGIEGRPLKSHHWHCDTVLDQGKEGACVGFGWSAELVCKPKIVPDIHNDFAFNLYNRAKQLDDWTGEDYSGTSVLAGAKAVQEHVNLNGEPLVGEYRWAFGTEDVLRVIGHRGPVVLGVTWYDNMYEPDENNYIHAAGEVVGGHCILANGVHLVPLDDSQPVLSLDNVDLDKSRIVLHNSWGASWGNNGEARLTVRDLTALLDEQGGEACIPSRRRV